MKTDNFSSSDLISSISSMRTFCQSLKIRDEIYRRVLDQVLQYDYYKEYDVLPSNKNLCAKLNINGTKLKKYLEQIYLDLLEIMFQNPLVFSIPKLSYHLYIRGFRESKSVTLNGSIPFCPRVGDQVQLPFLRAHFSTMSFFVERVNHEFTDKEQIICIWLKYGFYNQYEAFKKDQDYSEGNISINDYYDS